MDAFVAGFGGEDQREASGHVEGLAVATVTDNKDPEGLARVRVRLVWQEEGDESYWARVVTPMAMNERGVYFLPEIGDEVLVGFERGDMSHPFIIGSLWNGKQKPPEKNDDGNNDLRLIRSRSGHELRFDDGDPPIVELKLQDGKHLVMDDKGLTLEDGHGNRLKIESSSGAITIESSGQLKLKSRSVSIEADASMEIKATGTLTLTGHPIMLN